MKQSSLQRLRRVGRVVGLLLLVALAFELFLRLFGYGSYVLYGPDDELLWLPLPDQRAKTVANHEPITMNGQSLRYREDLSLRSAEETRLFTFGDSVTMGWGVDDDSHYTAVLETRLREAVPGREFRAVSAGVNAYPTALCTRRFLELLEDGMQIDVAILAYSFNEAFAPVVAAEGSARERLLLRVGLKSLVRRSAIYNFLIEDLLRTAVYYPLRDRLLPGSWEVTEKPMGELDLSGYVASLAAFQAAAEQHDVRPIFLLLGSMNQRGRLRPHQTAFLEFARQHDIPVANIVGRIEDLDHEKLFMDHTHPTREGHALIAGELLPLVEGVLAADAG